MSSSLLKMLTRTEPEFLLQVLEAVIQAGATTLNIPDTVGYTVPLEFGDLTSATFASALAGHRTRHHFHPLSQ